MAWKAYYIIAIDFGWDLLPTVEDVAALIARSEAAEVVGSFTREESQIPKFFADFALARNLAKEAGWEGDYRRGHEPRVFWLPVEGKFAYAFAWKQDNNGDTLVVSPQPLDWLKPLESR
jgi:hypothetical protein